MLPVYNGCTPKLDGGQFLNAQAKLNKPVAEPSGEFSCEQKIWHGKLER